MDIEKLKNEIALKHGYQDGILGNAWDFAMQLTHRTKRQIALYEEVIAALAGRSHEDTTELHKQNVSVAKRTVCDICGKPAHDSYSLCFEHLVMNERDRKQIER